MKRNKGFTLVELLIVIIIIGVLAGIAIPQFMNTVEKAKGSEARSMIANIQKLEKIHYVENDAYTANFSDFDEITVAPDAPGGNFLTGAHWTFELLMNGADLTITARRSGGVELGNTIIADENEIDEVASTWTFL